MLRYALTLFAALAIFQHAQAVSSSKATPQPRASTQPLPTAPGPGVQEYVPPAPQELPDIPFPTDLLSIDRSFRAAQPATANIDWVYILIYKPNVYFNFSSPYGLYRSIYWQNFGNLKAVMNGGDGLNIGHTEVAWKCASGAAPPVMGATGHTGDRAESSIRMIKEGGGMTPLFLDYMDGYLEKARMVDDRFKQYHDLVRMVAVAVTPGDCRRVDRFFHAFAASPGAQRFGLLADPTKLEGGVCWSTARAMVQHVPALREMFDQYMIRFGVPQSLMGDPPSMPEFVFAAPSIRQANLRKVEIDDFNGPFATWNSRTEPNFPYKSFDFQQFTADFERGFSGCRREWCQSTLARGASLVRATSTSGLVTDIYQIDGRPAVDAQRVR